MASGHKELELRGTDDAHVRVAIPTASACSTMLAEYCTELASVTTLPPFTIPGATQDVLDVLVAFMGHRAVAPAMSRIKRPLPAPASLALCGAEPWYADFISGVSPIAAMDVMEAADYLRMDDLTELCAARVAQQYLLMKPELRDAVFAVPRELSPEDENKLRDAHKWVEEEPDAITQVSAVSGIHNAD